MSWTGALLDQSLGNTQCLSLEALEDSISMRKTLIQVKKTEIVKSLV